MRAGLRLHSLIAIGLLVWTGCNQNPYMLQRQVAAQQQEHQQLARQAQELQAKAASLDKDNQELEAMLAQERQARKVADDQVAALQDQLHGTTDQLDRLREQYVSTEKKAETFAASARRRAGATIKANNSRLDNLPALNLPGVQARHDGDVIRIEIPAARLFDEGSAQLRSDAGRLLDAVAAEIARTYPDQFVGVEGHTDASALPAGKFANQHQFSSARASAVMDYLSTQGKLRPNQLFVTGHGANHPAASNATPSGRERNRRIELVVYPERRPAG